MGRIILLMSLVPPPSWFFLHHPSAHSLCGRSPVHGFPTAAAPSFFPFSYPTCEQFGACVLEDRPQALSPTVLVRATVSDMPTVTRRGTGRGRKRTGCVRRSACPVTIRDGAIWQELLQ